MENEKSTEKSEQTLISYDFDVLLSHMLRYFRRLWVLFLAITVACGGFMYYRAVSAYRPMYRAEAVFSASVQYTNTTDIMSYNYYYDNAAAGMVESTFPYILQSDVMREKLLRELNTSNINGSISAKSVEGTNIFILSVTSRNPSDAYTILCAVMDVYPQVSTQVLGETQISISREPTLPTVPYNAVSWKQPTAIGVLAGILISGLILLMLSVLRRTVIRAEDVMKLVNLPCIARVPLTKRKRRASGHQGGLIAGQMSANSAFSESFRLLKLHLLRQLSPEDKVILFTSSVPAEGKSTIAVNTALALAKDGKKVLLIDGDLRGQSVKDALSIQKESTGLGGFLAGACESYTFLRYPDTSLYVFAGDERVQSPMKLLKSEKLPALFADLREMVDYIIVDTPPSNMMADASILGRYADKIVYVIRRDCATRAQIFDGIQTVAACGAGFAGFVFNHERLGGSKYGYGYGKYGYGSKYGYGNYGYGYRKYGYGGYGYGSYGYGYSEKESGAVPSGRKKKK